MALSLHDWSINEEQFNPEKLNHSETVYTIGNGYLSTRGTFEEYFPGENRSTFIHGIFDDVPVTFTELANSPDWLEMEIFLDGERFSLSEGTLLGFKRSLELNKAVLRREVRWQSPSGKISKLIFQRFTSLSNIHLCGVRLSITPENYEGMIEVRSGLNGGVDNLGFLHWHWISQACSKNYLTLVTQTRSTKKKLAVGLSQSLHTSDQTGKNQAWDVHNHPSQISRVNAKPGQEAILTKWVTLFTDRDVKDAASTTLKAVKKLNKLSWEEELQAHEAAWAKEWDRCDVIVEGDAEAQIALRFNIFQLLIAAPRNDERVNIGAKTLSGYGYRGHSFWDTETFMLPFFTYTSPAIARNLLSYRWHNLPGARTKAQGNGYEGAQYPWESADTGEEVTPTWVPDPKDRTKLIRIWTGDIEIHISSDIAYAINQYWKATGDDAFMAERGAEVILETARFWASRAEWHAELNRYELNDVIGPDEYHDHVDNNVYTNVFARWNLMTALNVLNWMKECQPAAWKKLQRTLKFKDKETEKWQHVIEHIYIPFDAATRVIEQFEGYFERKDVDLAAMEPRTNSIQEIFGIEGSAQTQVLKQPDVLMMMFMLPDLYDEATIKANYAYYTPRTDHTFGSSLGPSIQAIMACRVGDPSAYEHFMRAARADLFDVRNNASDGIHGASAGGLWQAAVFGFAGLTFDVEKKTWHLDPSLPENWKRIAFKFNYQGKTLEFDTNKR